MIQADAYARMACWYDRLLNPLLDGTRRRVATMCARQPELHSQGHGVVLDICCGTARQGVFLAQAGVRWAGVDRSPSMLAAASRNTDRNSGRNALLMRADSTRLPFADASFALSAISFALHEQPADQAERTLAEALRVASRCLVVDYTMAERNLELPSQWLMMVPERMVGGEHWRNFRSYMRAGAMQGMLHRAGAVILEREPLFGGGAAICLCARGEAV